MNIKSILSNISDSASDNIRVPSGYGTDFLLSQVAKQFSDMDLYGVDLEYKVKDRLAETGKFNDRSLESSTKKVLGMISKARSVGSIGDANNSNRVIVAFHIGRGGHFNNPGFKTYLGELNFQDLQRRAANFISYVDRDYRGRFQKSTIVNGSGNEVSDDDPKGLVGRLDFDGEYDTDYCRYVEDCTDEELEVISKSSEYKSPELVSYLEEHGFGVE